MKQAYTREQLFDIARENYRTLVYHCATLHTEGYWKQPEKLMHLSIREYLDLYLQSVLLLFALKYNCFGKSEHGFLMEITEHNPLRITKEEEATKELYMEAEKMLNAPPILLQLCSLRDHEKKSNLAIMFMDTFINILIAMAYLEKENTEALLEYLQQYFMSIEAFLGQEMNYLQTIDQRYIFRKVCSATFRTGYKVDELNKGRETGQIVADEDLAEVKEEVTKEAKRKLQEAKDAKRYQAVENYMNQLEDLVGLESVKQEMQSLVNLIKVRKMRSNYEMPQFPMSYHMVFTGNAGTGKTTVARIVANIYKELGVVSKGTLIETDRAGLVAGYLGQTAMKVKEVVEKAKGGILFIDEAYALTSRDASDDYGIEAIDTLVKMMEDYRDDLVVIVAGYGKEMERFLKSNTGLVSRFNKYIEFPDYTNEQLVEILKTMVQKAGMQIKEEALVKLHSKLQRMTDSQRKDFGNARGIRNTFEKIVTNQANRIVTYSEPTKEQLCEILVEDI